VRYRTIPLPGGDARRVDCFLGDRRLHRWAFDEANHSGEIVIELPAKATGMPVELAFVTTNAPSPAELGLGPDVRPLALGVEQVRLLD
jgi:hypothetical protein